MNKWHSLLNMMMIDMNSTNRLYQPTNFWQHGVAELLQDLKTSDICNFRQFASCLKYIVPTYALPGYRENDISISIKNKTIKQELLLEQFLSGKFQAQNDYCVYLAGDVNKQPFINTVSESQIGNPVEQFEFNDRFFSRSMLNYLLGLCFLKNNINDSETINTVLEIGGGFGTLGEMLLTDKRNNIFYIDVDIPPVAVFASYYLSEIFGDSSVGCYDSLSHTSELKIDQLRESYHSIILMPWQLENLQGNVDLFVNFISFQEMEPDVVQNYLSHVNRLSAKYILLRNLREGKNIKNRENPIGVEQATKGDDYDRFLPDYKLLATNVFPYGLKTVDNFHSELRLYQKKSY